MLALLNFLNALSFPIFQPILMILVSKFMVHRALSDKTIIIRVAVPFRLEEILKIFVTSEHKGLL